MIRLLVLLSTLILLVACATAGRANKLESVLYTYQSTIRWGDLAGAVSYIDPALREKQGPSALQIQRMGQLQVAGYYVQAKQQPDENTLEQVVEIRVVNRHTQVERSVVDRQVWRWSAKDNAWWLTTGLPDFSPR